MDKGFQAVLASTSVRVESRPEGFPMTRTQAKAEGLKVYPSMTRCTRVDKHGNLRLTLSNRCVQCVELERAYEADLRATAMDKLRAEVERKLRKEMKAEIAEAHREAKAIIQDAQREASDKAKMLAKAQATREARRLAALAARQGPARPSEGASAPCSSVDDSAPWD
jgi:hypothetical protein